MAGRYVGVDFIWAQFYCQNSNSIFSKKLSLNFLSNNCIHMNCMRIPHKESCVVQLGLLKFGNNKKDILFSALKGTKIASAVAMLMKSIVLQRIEAQFFAKQLSLNYFAVQLPSYELYLHLQTPHSIELFSYTSYCILQTVYTVFCTVVHFAEDFDSPFPSLWFSDTICSIKGILLSTRPQFSCKQYLRTSVYPSPSAFPFPLYVFPHPSFPFLLLPTTFLFSVASLPFSQPFSESR